MGRIEKIDDVSTSKDFEYIVPLKNSPYVKEVMERVDEWMSIPEHKVLISRHDDKPQFCWAPSRSSDPKEFNEVLSTFFQYDYYPRDLYTKDFVVLDKDGSVMGYFHCTIDTLPPPEGESDPVICAYGVRAYHFHGSHYRMGKAQRAFYEYLYEKCDVISIMFLADGHFTRGEIDGLGRRVENTKTKRIFDVKQVEGGFSQPSMFKNIAQRYGGVFNPYTLYYPDINGNDRFLHMVRWRGKRGHERGMPNFPVNIIRGEATIAKLKEHGIHEYV